MNITDALYRAVRGYPGGAESLAPRMGISSASLSHKVSPNYPGAHCSPEEMMQVCELTHDHGPLQAAASQLGYALLPLEQGAEVDAEFSARLAADVKEFGDFIGDVSATLADGKVTDNELKRIEADLSKMLTATMQLYAWVVVKNKACKPGGGISA